MTYQHDDGTIIRAAWAASTVGPFSTELDVDSGLRATAMYGTNATGQRMVSNGHLGVDLIRVPAGDGFAPHTHPGDHLLIAIAGEGTITVDGRIYPTRAGQLYMVEGAIPHAVAAITDHVLLAVGAPHRHIDAADRMALSEYEAVAARLGTLTCLVCDTEPEGTPEALRKLGCPHVPAEAPETRPLLVGLAPPAADHVEEGLRPFEHTTSGARLAALLDIAEDRLLEAVDTANLSPVYLPRWESIPAGRWAALAEDHVLPRVAGRVVICAGPRVARALGADAMTGTAEVVEGPAGYLSVDPAPFLAVVIPHPQTLTGDAVTAARAAASVQLAMQMARTGPARGRWDAGDADAFNEAALRLSAEWLATRA